MIDVFTLIVRVEMMKHFNATPIELTAKCIPLFDFREQINIYRKSRWLITLCIKEMYCFIANGHQLAADSYRTSLTVLTACLVYSTFSA